MADAAIYDSEIEDLRSVYANDDSDSDDASIDISDEARQRESRRRACSIEKRHDEDGEVRALSPGIGSSLVGSTSRPPASPWEDESAAILDAGPLRPPPDYAAATAHRDEQRLARVRRLELAEEQEWPLDGRAEVFDSGHPLVRNGLMMTSDEPSSTNETTGSEPHHDSNHEDGFRRSSDEEKTEVLAPLSYWSKKKSAWKRRGRKSWLRSSLIVLMVFVVTYFALTNYSPRRISSLQSRPASAGSSFEKPHLSHLPIADCLWTNYKSTSADIYYDLPDIRHYEGIPHFNFSFLEALTPRPRDIRLSGRITVMGPTKKMDDYARVTVEVASTPNLWVNEIQYTVESGNYELLYPDIDPRSTSGCLDFAITIEHDHGWHLGNFTVNTTYFDIDIDGHSLFATQLDPWTQGMDGGLWVQNGTFSTVHGAIAGRGWESNKTEVSSEAGGITGTWPLRSILALDTGSGDIRVSVAPQPGVRSDRYTPLYSEENAYIAGLNAKSVDGSITIKIAQEKKLSTPPERDYQAHISSVNGNIYGDYLFGSNASVATKSGEINVRMIPITIDPPNATLYTENESGFSNVWILKPVAPGRNFTRPQVKDYGVLNDPAEIGTMASLQAMHRSESGAARYIVPTVWSGTAVLQCESRIILDDDIFEVLLNETRDGARMNVVRGHGWSTMDIKAEDGEILFLAYDG